MPGLPLGNNSMGASPAPPNRTQPEHTCSRSSSPAGCPRRHGPSWGVRGRCPANGSSRGTTAGLMSLGNSGLVTFTDHRGYGPYQVLQCGVETWQQNRFAYYPLLAGNAPTQRHHVSDGPALCGSCARHCCRHQTRARSQHGSIQTLTKPQKLLLKTTRMLLSLRHARPHACNHRSTEGICCCLLTSATSLN